VTKRKLLVEIDLGDAIGTDCNHCPHLLYDQAKEWCTSGVGQGELLGGDGKRLPVCVQAERSADTLQRASVVLSSVAAILEDGREYNEDCDRTLARVEDAL